MINEFTVRKPLNKYNNVKSLFFWGGGGGGGGGNRKEVLRSLASALKCF